MARELLRDLAHGSSSSSCRQPADAHYHPEVSKHGPHILILLSFAVAHPGLCVFRTCHFSLIGYSYSSQAPLDRELGTEGCARIMNSLMKGLGYDKYVLQGGDLGAFLGRFMAIRFDECQGEYLR